MLCKQRKEAFCTHKGTPPGMEDADDGKNEFKENDVGDLKEGMLELRIPSQLPSFEEIWSFQFPSTFVIPGSLINEWARIVQRILDDLITLPAKDSVDAWKRMFMVAKCLWARTREG